MLRTLLVLLVLANLLFFGWTRGALAPLLPPPQQGERDPGRLQAQVRPEALTILPPSAASAAVRAARATACLEAGPVSAAALGTLDEALQRGGIPPEAVARVPVQQPAQWVVYIGPFVDAEAQARREQQLRQQQFESAALNDERAPRPGLALGLHATREAADQALAALGQRGLRGARVLELPAREQTWLRAGAADAVLQGRLKGAETLPEGLRFGACAVTR